MKESVLKLYRAGRNHREITSMMYCVERVKDKNIRLVDIEQEVIKIILEAHKRG